LLVNKVLVKALKEKASDIHIEPQEVFADPVSQGWGAGQSLSLCLRKLFQP